MQGQTELKDVDIKSGREPGESTEEVTIRLVDSLLEYAKRNDAGGESREQTFTRMDRLHKYYADGGLHRFKNMPKHRARAITNKCYSVVEGALPIIVDNRPKAELVPGAEADHAVVEKLKMVYDAKYDDLNLEMKTTLAVKSALVPSEGYWKVFWNPLKMGGLGDVDVQLVDPKRMFFIGGCDPLLQDAYAVIYHGPHTLGELQAWYPKKAKAIDREWMSRGSGTDYEHYDLPDYYGKHRAGSDDGTGTVMRYFGAEGGGRDGREQLMLTEAWIDDKTLFEHAPDYIVTLADSDGGDDNTSYTIVGEATESNIAYMSNVMSEYEVINGKDLPKLGLEKRTKMLRKYPFGRIIAKVGKTLLCDKPSPYTHGKCPYVRFFVCPVPGKNYFWGELDQIISLQDLFNKRNSQITDILGLTANPPMLVNIMSGIKPKKMTNEAGLIIPVSMDVSKAAQWLHTPNIPSALFADVQRINDDIDSVSGYHDITAGRKPAGVTAGVAIESLQEAAQTRYRQKARYVEYSLAHAAELMLSVIWQFYKEPRIVRAQDEDNPGKYKFENVDFSKAKLVGGLPDVKIKSGSTMPVNEAVRRSQAGELMQIIGSMSPAAGLAFLPALLKKWDWPDVDGTMKSIKEAIEGEKQMMMQAQTQQAQKG